MAVRLLISSDFPLLFCPCFRGSRAKKGAGETFSDDGAPFLPKGKGRINHCERLLKQLYQTIFWPDTQFHQALKEGTFPLPVFIFPFVFLPCGASGIPYPHENRAKIKVPF